MHRFHGIQASHAGPYLVTFSYDGRTAYISVNGTPDEPQTGTNSFGNYDPNFAGLSVTPAPSSTAFQS
jgi:hypothetical protein